MFDFAQDLRFGVRMLLKTPGVMLVAAVSLAVGIAANTVTFAVAHGFLLEPFPYEDQDTLVVAVENHRTDGEDRRVAPGNFVDWRDRSSVFEHLVAYAIVPANLTGGETPVRVQLVDTSYETFSMLGRTPFLGRDFRPEDRDAGDVVILSHAFWDQYFQRAPDALGDEVLLDGKPHTVVGVMPDDFDFLPANVDVYRAVDFRARIHDREDRSLMVMGRLRDGRGVEEAGAELASIASQLETEYPEHNAGFGVRVLPLRELFPGPTDTSLMYILLTVAGFVLVIACANIGNLLLARAEGRQREVAVRTAMGAGRARILRQLLTESTLLAILGGVLGTLLSIYGVRFVGTAMPAELPKAFMPELDGAVLLYTLGVSLLAGALFGMAPALHSFADDVRESLGEHARGGTASRKRNRLRSAFVVAEIASALALLVGGGVLMAIFNDLVGRSAGFDVRGVLSAQLTASEDRYPEEADVARFYEEVERRLEEVAGIESVAVMINLPRSRDASSTGFTIDGRELPGANEEPTTGWQSVNPDYFEALGVPILQGRGLRPSDRADGRPVLVVNERFASDFFADADPIGAQVTLLGQSRQIVGIARNVNQTRMPTTGGEFGPVVYVPLAQHPSRSASLAMRVEGEPVALADEVRAAIWTVDPEQPVTAIQPLDDHIAASLSGPRVLSLVLGLFGAAALVLSAMGIYGVMAHSVVQRRREIGIRMALGARREDVLGLVTRQGMKLACIGLLVGAPMAFGLVRVIQSMLLAEGLVDPAWIVGVTALLAGVSLAATCLPALRASRLNPVRALQAEG